MESSTENVPSVSIGVGKISSLVKEIVPDITEPQLAHLGKLQQGVMDANYLSNCRVKSTYEQELARLSMTVERSETISQGQPTNIMDSPPAAFYLAEIRKYVNIIAPKITEEQLAQLTELQKLVISATAASTRLLRAEYEAKVSKMKNEVEISVMLDNLERALASKAISSSST
ncbi:unnamed protein product [Caenorhabditis nigoni]